MESSRELGGCYSTKHAVVLLGVDAIFLGEALDTVRSILLPCWAHYLSNAFSLCPLTKRTLPKYTKRQSSSAPKLLARQQHETVASVSLPAVVPQARALNHFHEDLATIHMDSYRAIRVQDAGAATVHGGALKIYSIFLYILFFPDAPSGWWTLRDRRDGRECMRVATVLNGHAISRAPKFLYLTVFPFVNSFGPL